MSYPAESFHTGDRVRFRQWDDMASEFPCGPDGDIRLPGVCFSRGMAHLCGTEATITSVTHWDDWYSMAYLTDFQYRGRGGTSWYYSTDMLEPASDYGTFSGADFVAMLGGGQA